MDTSAANSVPVVPRKRWQERVIDSPLLLVVLVLATAALAFKWYTLEQSLKAPILPGWSWATHPNTLLIYYPHTDCGCGPGLASALAQTKGKRFDVAVVTDTQNQKLSVVAQEVSNAHAQMLTSIRPEMLRRWCHAGNTTILRIRNGRVVSCSDGTTIPDTLLKN